MAQFSMQSNVLAGTKTNRAPVRLAPIAARKIVCQAQKQEPMQKVGSLLAATALTAALSLSAVDAAKADIAGLTPCSESKAFQKRQKNEVKNLQILDFVLLSLLEGLALAAGGDIAGLTPCSESKAFQKRQKNEVKNLQKRLKQYEADSAPALALKATIDRTEKRFATYGKQGLLCGTDGLPHLISDPGLAIRYGHSGEVLIPTVGFLYVAGYIGSVGREYLQLAKKEKKPTDKEIIIDVPLALKLSFQGIGWPLRAVQQLRNGSLLEDDRKITVSPR